jgi:hypothetical protein
MSSLQSSNDASNYSMHESVLLKSAIIKVEPRGFVEKSAGVHALACSDRLVEHWLVHDLCLVWVCGVALTIELYVGCWDLRIGMIDQECSSRFSQRQSSCHSGRDTPYHVDGCWLGGFFLNLGRVVINIGEHSASPVLEIQSLDRPMRYRACKVLEGSLS